MRVHSQLEQYDAALNVPVPALASTYLDHLLSHPGHPYICDSHLTEEAVDAALVRIRAAGSTGVPEEAEAARKWLHPQCWTSWPHTSTQRNGLSLTLS